MRKINEWALNPTPAESAWIKYKLELTGTTAKYLATKLSIDCRSVYNVIGGHRHSRKIEQEIAKVCGYPSWNDMLRSLRGENVA
ncbi:MAG: hypothetical protein J6K22_08250 [Spirochaetaceae bacterium]|nr:hypothetical protein [Spirochaetaceae bacterium]